MTAILGDDSMANQPEDHAMHVELEQRGHLLVIGVRRPEKMNALSRDMYRALARAMYRLEHDPDLWVGVIWAEGPHFTSGVDLGDWAEAFASGTPFPIGPEEIDPFSMSGPRLSKPLVIGVQGRCYTWGWELLLNTDLRVAATDTRFAMLEVRRGFYACGGATLRLPREIGWANAQRYLLTGDELGAEEAHRLGLVQELCAPGEQLDAALALAARVAKAAPLGVRGSLRSSRLCMLEGEDAAIGPMFAGMAEVMQSEDAAEGVRSFVERREAVFKGR
jgi:enoyl-CoA hydratase/carnithine racemase